MCRAKPGVSLLLILIFLAGVAAPVPECFVTRLLCPQARAYACAAPLAKAPLCHSAVAACRAKPEKHEAVQPLRAGVRARLKPYEPEREIVVAPVCPAALLPSLLHKPDPLELSPFALETLSPGNVPEPIPILLGKKSFLI